VRSCVFVVEGIDFASCYDFFLLDFGTVPIVRVSCFSFYHFYRLKKSTLIEEMKICRNTDL